MVNSASDALPRDRTRPGQSASSSSPASPKQGGRPPTPSSHTMASLTTAHTLALPSVRTNYDWTVPWYQSKNGVRTCCQLPAADAS